ncbi:MAG TPA: CRISPR system precrRNA processing endoribonuclease RAMP protein Cas6 [Candidatus Ozemobacteraceae bacterium]|nr:CRISPR system precrRNA processing endoribonuclease RAMP protein Cas6 [Candidatus Ozemobacteraceae bacterium]
MRYLELIVELRPQAALSFPPNPVNTLRGALGYQLKRIVCFQRNRPDNVCRGCLAEHSCAYAITFETATSPSSNATTGGGGDAPHPFVLNADFQGPRLFRPPETARFRLTLFGRAVDTLPFLTQALREAATGGLGRDRIPCDLVAMNQAGTGTRLYDPATHTLAPYTPETVSIEQPAGWGGEPLELSLTFETPTAFKDKTSGKIVNQPEFHRIIRSILRRITAIAPDDLTAGPPWNFRDIIDRAMQVSLTSKSLSTVFWERVSSRQNQRATWGGTVGTALYRGDIRPFLSLLRAGELLRIGRGTIFGQGRYRIASVTPPEHACAPASHAPAARREASLS